MIKKTIKKLIKYILVGAIVCSMCLGCFYAGMVYQNSTLGLTGLMSPKFSKIYEIINNHWYNYGTVEGDIENILLSGMVSSLNDPYSAYLSSTEATIMKDSLAQEDFCGIGIVYSNILDQNVVSKVSYNAPAKEAGLKAGDIIDQVNGKDASKLTQEELRNEIRGKEGTTVDIRVYRNKEYKNFTIERRKIASTVALDIVDSGKESYGIISILSFSENTAESVKDQLQILNEKKIKNLVFDLRGNSGGYLLTAIDILEFLIEPGHELCRLDYASGEEEIIESKLEPIYKAVQGYILVDEGTASASEILAGTLQEELDYKLVGKNTFGKGIAQRTYTFEDNTELKYTFAKWLLPSGKNIQGEGLKPDIEVEKTKLGNYDLIKPDKNYQYDDCADAITSMQNMLSDLGYKIKRKDGYFDVSTKEALTQFEKQHQLKTDGIYSNEDYTMMLRDLLNKIYDEKNDMQNEKIKELFK